MASTIVKLEDVRLAFSQNLFKAGFVPSDPAKKMRYSSLFLQKKDHPVYLKGDDGVWKKMKMVDVLHHAALPAWKDNDAAILNAILGNHKDCFWYNGALKAKHAGFTGNFVVSATRPIEKGRPHVVNRDGTPLTEADGKPYAGCYVNATIEIWAQNNQWGNALRATLRSVQFVRDGEAFGGGEPLDENELPPLDASEIQDNDY